MRPVPEWLITDDVDYVERDLGNLKSGKEAEVFVVERTYQDRSVPARAQALPAAHGDAQGRARGARLPARQQLHERSRVPRRPEVREVARPARGRAHDEIRQEAADRSLDRPRARDDAAGVERRRERSRIRSAPAATACSCSSSATPNAPRRVWPRRGSAAAEIRSARAQLVDNLRLLVAPASCTPTCRRSTCCGGTTSSG